MRHPIISNIWRQRREIGGPWGWSFTVGYDFDEYAIASGWRRTEEDAKEDVAAIVAEAESKKQPWE